MKKIKPDDNMIDGGCDNCRNKKTESQYKWRWNTHSESWEVICSECFPNDFKDKEEQ